MATDPQQAISPQEILDALGKALVVSDAHGVIVYWNPAATRLYGWSAEEAVGRKAVEVTASELAPEVREEIGRSVRNHVPWSGGLPVRQRDGTMITTLVTVNGIFHDDVPVGVVSVSINLGKVLAPLLERSTDAALVLRSDAVITYASPAVEQLFGWTDSVVGTSIVPLLHPDERPALAQFMAEVVGQPGAHPALEIRLLTETGWVWAEAALTNLLDDPEVRGVVCNLRCSVRREAHESAERQVDQLTTALRSRVLIEQAKGYLAARHGVTPDEAFTALRGHARSRQVLIHECARQVVEGRLDPLRSPVGGPNLRDEPGQTGL